MADLKKFYAGKVSQRGTVALKAILRDKSHLHRELRCAAYGELVRRRREREKGVGWK